MNVIDELYRNSGAFMNLWDSQPQGPNKTWERHNDFIFFGAGSVHYLIGRKENGIVYMLMCSM